MSLFIQHGDSDISSTNDTEKNSVPQRKKAELSRKAILQEKVNTRSR